MIQTERRGDVAELILNRPEKRNAMTPVMLEDARAGLASLAGCRVLLLRGNGPVFCGGFDLKMCLDKPGTLDVLLRGLSSLIEELKDFASPVVCLAHGAAIAGGCALLGGCDVVVTDDQAKLGYPVTPLGVSPAVSAPFLRNLIGDGPGRERMLDPRLISGAEAVGVGLAHESLPTPGEALTRARAIAAELALKPPAAMAATRAWLAQIERAMSVPTATSLGLDASLSVVGSPEERERLTALFART